MTTSMSDAVASYTANGIIVHPIAAAIPGNPKTGKNPIVSEWSTRTEPYAKNFMEKHIQQGCNIGANCGKPSNLTVIDIDFEYKGIWDFIFSGIDTSKLCIQKRTNQNGKKHLMFKYSPLLKEGVNEELGFDIRNDGGNIVLAPSVHFSGDVYTLLSPIETRTELPEMAAEKINHIIELYSEFKRILGVCRPCFYKLWKDVFLKKSSDIFHDVTIFRTSEGRMRHLYLFAEMKANGATDELLNLVCMMIFGEFYDPDQSMKQIKAINEKRPAKNTTLKEDEYYGKYFNSSDDAPVGKELTEEEIRACKEGFKDRRLPLELPPSHFVSVFCDWLSGLTDGYTDYQKLGALWLISAFCDNKVEVRLKQGIVKPNIFVTIFGKSTTARKSTVVQRTRQIYESVTGSYLPNEDFSIEGYLESLSMNPNQHHVRDEVAGFLAKIHKQYNEGFNELECAVYDGQNFRKTLASKGNKEPKVFDIRHPYVTKFYATTPDNYMKFMTIEDFLCGREYRTLFSFPTYSKPKMALGVETNNDVKKWTLVLERAGELYRFIENSQEIRFNFNPEALEYYSTVTSALEDGADKADNDMLCSAVGRSQIHMLKIAMLIELGKYPISTTITKESIRIAANAVISYFIPTLMDVIDRLQEDVKNNMVEKVISVIRRHGGAVQHTRALHDAKLKSKDFAEVIETLKESETIEAVTETKTRKSFYILTEMKKNLDLTTFENLPNLQNLPSHSISYGDKSEEILETLNNITLSVHVCSKNNESLKNIDSLPCEVRQSNKIISLQNLSHVSTIGDEEIREIREIKEIETVVVTEEEALKMLEEEGF